MTTSVRATVSLVSRVLLALALVAATAGARAATPSFVVESIYSTADGTVQYLVLREARGADGQTAFAGVALTATHGAAVHRYVFPADLGGAATAGKRVLVASRGFALQNVVAPDYVVPDRFFPTDGATVDFGGADSVTYAALPTDGSGAWQRDGSTAPNLARNFAGLAGSAPGGAIGVVEFYNATLDHYFMSPLAPDIDALDTGRIAGWGRTGYVFDALPTPAAGRNPVCRFYIPPQHGDSHFFTASPAECAAVAAKIPVDPNYSGYSFETPAAFHLPLPDTTSGACPAGTFPVYRLWNQRADSNHRYATGEATRATMLQAGYVPEGYGPLGAAMCTPRTSVGDSLVRIAKLSPFAPGCDGVPVTAALFASAEVEPMIAANPVNGDLLAAWQQDRWSDGGARGLRTAISRDGGLTWSTGQAPFSRCAGGTVANRGNYARASDPWVTFSSRGTAFHIGIAFTGATFAANSVNAVLVSRSPDGGATWDAPLPLIVDGPASFNDKESIAGDRWASGIVYATWDRLDRNGGGPTYFARTTDDGATWEPARATFDPGNRAQTINNQVVSVPGSAQQPFNTFNFFTQIDTPASGPVADRIGLLRSQDRGATWSGPIYVSNVQSVGVKDPQTGTGVRDGENLGAFAAGANGQLAAVWQDARFSGGARDGIAFSRSLDGGATWSAPVGINAVASTQAFLPAVAIRDDGTIGILYYDLRNDTGNPDTLPADAWLATSTDGVTWTEQHIAGPFDLAQAPLVSGEYFVGDYLGLATRGSDFVAALMQANAPIAGAPANATDPYVAVVKGVPGPAKRAAAGASPGADGVATPSGSVYRAVAAPMLVPDASLQARLSESVQRTLAARHVGPIDPAP